MEQQIKNEIPEGWKETIFECICEKLQSGGTPLTSRKEYYNGEIPFVKIEDITAAKKYIDETIISISKEGLENSSAWIVPKDSLLLAIYGSFGKLTINKIPLATNQAILGIILNKRLVDIDFIYYLINNTNLKKYAKKSTQANLTAEIIRNLKIIIPKSLQEQRAISLILSTADDAIQKIEDEIKITEKLKRGIINKLFKNPNWTFVKLNDKDICLQITDGFHNSVKKDPYGVPLIKVENIYEGVIHFETTEKISRIAYEKEKSRCYPQKGDVVLTCVGSIGRTAVIQTDKEFALVRSVALLKPAKFINSYYLNYALNSLYSKQQMEAFQNSTTRKGLYLERIQKIEIPIPYLENKEKSFAEQQKTALILSTIDKKIEYQKLRKEKLERIKKGLMNDLLSGKKRINVENVLNIGE